MLRCQALSWPVSIRHPAARHEVGHVLTTGNAFSRPARHNSGHTAAAVAFTAAVAVAPIWPAAGAVCALPTALVANQRVQFGAHYPTDVAVGAAIGLAAAALVRRAPRLVLR
ncbi:phosphatase PAP2 family protein [Streptomyces sp. NPDC002778]